MRLAEKPGVLSLWPRKKHLFTKIVKLGIGLISVQLLGHVSHGGWINTAMLGVDEGTLRANFIYSDIHLFA
jgi:hypothetical protein